MTPSSSLSGLSHRRSTRSLLVPCATETAATVDHVLAKLLPAEITLGGLKCVLPLLEQVKDSTTDRAAAQHLSHIYCKRGVQAAQAEPAPADQQARHRAPRPASSRSYLGVANALTWLYGGSDGGAKVHNLKAFSRRRGTRPGRARRRRGAQSAPLGDPAGRARSPPSRTPGGGGIANAANP